MRFSLLRSKWVWSLILLWNVICSLVEVGATTSCVESSSITKASVNVGIALLDVWAGVSSFSDGFSQQAHVPVLEAAWIENAPAAVALLTAVYAGAKYCTNFYNYRWTDWKFKHDLVVTGGPSCCPFSVSGKRLRQHDIRSTQGMDTAALTVHLGATVLIIENVRVFLDEDHLHKLVSEMENYLHGHGYSLVASWVLLDPQLGGSSGRERVFLVWESFEMASVLPAWPAPPHSVGYLPLKSHLEPIGKGSHLAVAAQSEFVLDGSWTGSDQHATRIGSIWLHGWEDCWMKGEALKLKDDHRMWRIIEITTYKLRLMFDSRSQPKFLWVSKKGVSFAQRHFIHF